MVSLTVEPTISFLENILLPRKLALVPVQFLQRSDSFFVPFKNPSDDFSLLLSSPKYRQKIVLRSPAHQFFLDSEAVVFGKCQSG